jgi:2-oxoacid dehydrogenases acyltransferase (catalytic domain)/Esterase FrsA-like
MSNGRLDLAAIARARRHTLHFLGEIRALSPVFIDTEVDMTRVRTHRVTARAEGRSYSTMAYVLHEAARVLSAHPEANAAIRGRLRPRVARYQPVHGKLTLDKTLGGQRVVLSAVLRDLQHSDLDRIQQQIDRFRDGDADTMPEFEPARMLDRLPVALGRLAFRAGVRPLARRAAIMGTFAVTSLGHRPVDSFFSVGGTTITLGLGRTLERPVARDGQVVTAPTMRLSLTFDHRVIDGAEAADVLAEIKNRLESFPDFAEATVRPPAAAGQTGSSPTRTNDVGELKQYAVVHARGQRIKGYQDLLDRIHSDDEDAPGSWAGEWTRAGEQLEWKGHDLEAARYYALARFPYVNGAARQEAADRGVSAIQRWQAGNGDIEPLEVALKDGLVRCWTSGLSRTSPKPLLIVMGGIVTVKEQWAPMLTAMRRLGMAGLVTEMPGIGENTLRYQPDSWQMLSGLLDAVADQADVTQTYATAMSFSGHMAMSCALNDDRIKGIITVGAPVSNFFTDAAWQRKLPRITVDALAHMTGVAPDQVAGGLSEWALSAEQLAELDIPVFYAASSRDEIIPASEIDLLRQHVRNLSLVTHDDVHGSPRYVAEVQLWSVASLLKARGVRNPQSALVGLLLNAQRLRNRSSGSEQRN